MFYSHFSSKNFVRKYLITNIKKLSKILKKCLCRFIGSSLQFRIVEFFATVSGCFFAKNLFKSDCKERTYLLNYTFTKGLVLSPRKESLPKLVGSIVEVCRFSPVHAQPAESSRVLRQLSRYRDNRTTE